MGRHKNLIEINGVLATIDGHIEALGYKKGTVYRLAWEKGVNVADVLKDLKPKDAVDLIKKSNDPFERGYPWDIRGCENLINAVFKAEFNDLVEFIKYYLQRPTERNRMAVAYIEGWFRDALPNYYDITPDVIIEEAWRKAREKR